METLGLSSGAQTPAFVIALWATAVQVGLTLLVIAATVIVRYGSKHAASRRARTHERLHAAVAAWVSDPAALAGVRDAVCRTTPTEARAFFQTLLSTIDGATRSSLADLYVTLSLHTDDLSALRSCWATRRIAAVRRLSALGLPALHPPLLTAVEDRSPAVAAEAALGLAALRDPSAIEVLARLAPHMGRWAAVQMAAAARDLGIEGTERLKSVAQLHIDHASRSAALEALGLLGTQDATRELIATTHSSDHDLRARAARIIGMVGCTVAMDRMLDLLRDPRWEVRCQAARSLGRIGTIEAAEEPLRHAMRDEMWWVRRNAAHALWELGAAGSEALKDAVRSDPDRFARDIALDVLRTHGVADSEARLEDQSEWSHCSSTPSTWPSSSTPPLSE